MKNDVCVIVQNHSKRVNKYIAIETMKTISGIFNDVFPNGRGIFKDRKQLSNVT